jgi:hypothetical protein
MKIPDEAKKIVEEAKVWAVATANKNGLPNVVPIAYAKILSENQILLMDIFMEKTRKNIEENPNIALCAWNSESKGYQFKGKAQVITSGKLFDEGVKWVKSEEDLSPKSAIVVNVETAYIITPGSDAGKKVK